MKDLQDWTDVGFAAGEADEAADISAIIAAFAACAEDGSISWERAKELRSEFVEGYQSARDCTPKTAQNAFSVWAKRAGVKLEKSSSPAAKKKRAARAAQPNAKAKPEKASEKASEKAGEDASPLTIDAALAFLAGADSQLEGALRYALKNTGALKAWWRNTTKAARTGNPATVSQLKTG